MRVVVFGAEGWTGRAVLANLQGRHDIRTAVYSPASWQQWNDIDGDWQDGEVHYGDIVDDAYGMKTIVLRADYIVDSRLGIGRHREQLQGKYRNGWVCRHDLAEACRLSIESTIDHDILHVVGTPEAVKTCNVERTKTVLGMKFQGKLQQYQ
jgi:hypothetical protein